MKTKLLLIAALTSAALLRADPLTYDFSGTCSKSLSSVGEPTDYMPTIGQGTDFSGHVTIDTDTGQASNFTVSVGGFIFSALNPENYGSEVYAYTQPLVQSGDALINCDDMILKIFSMQLVMDGAFYWPSMYYGTDFTILGTVDSFTPETQEPGASTFAALDFGGASEPTGPVPDGAPTIILLGCLFAILATWRHREGPGFKHL